MTDSEFEHEVGRRTFLKAVGLAAGGLALGVGGTGSAAAAETPQTQGFSTRFANPRVCEAAKVWEKKDWRKGFRGRPDRTLALTDSGIDVRHPDLGPWNGVTAISEELGDGDPVPEVLLTDPEKLRARRGEDGENRKPFGKEHTETAVLGPGTTIEGTQTVVAEFTPKDKDIVDMDASLSWTPDNADFPAGISVLGLDSAGEDQSFSVQLKQGDSWVTIQTIDTGKNPEKLTDVTVVPGQKHRFVAGQFANVIAQGKVTWQYYTYTSALETIGEDSVFDFSSTGPTPKTVGWFDGGARYGSNAAPSDPAAHGSHVSGIMAGAGRASDVDPDRYIEESPSAILTAGDFLEYKVKAKPGTGVFGVATGEGIEVVIEGPEGRTLRTSGTIPVLDNKEALPIDDAHVDHPTVDTRHPTDADGEPQPATYTVYVRPAEGELVSTGMVKEVAVGAFLDPEETAGDRDGGPVSLHSGIAPDQGLFGLQGLSGPTAALGLYADQMTPLFNIRAVNMSWGGLVPGGGSIGGGGIQRAIKAIAEGGILTVAAAGNNFGTVNSAPAIADEAISVSATNYLDGITSYTDGGAQSQDEDGQGFYGKPDVCAPGGSLDAGARSVKAKAEGDLPAVEGVRDYVNFTGTSMASPYVCGTSALVAQAMEEGAPDAIRLPAPKELHAEGITAEERLDHVLRLKSVLLSTASSTAFTAAPYHRHAVTYRHDGRDTYEGFGRVNPDTAVDAVTRDLFTDATTDGKTTASKISGAVGLNVPDDSRAVAGYVQVGDGTLDVSLTFDYYSGGNDGLTQGAPHIDLFVYDAEQPGAHGTPNVLASDVGIGGSASVSVPVDSTTTRTLFVVAKLVNVPGVVNGYDVQAHFDLDLSFTAAGKESEPAPEQGTDGRERGAEHREEAEQRREEADERRENGEQNREEGRQRREEGRQHSEGRGRSDEHRG